MRKSWITTSLGCFKHSVAMSRSVGTTPISMYSVLLVSVFALGGIAYVSAASAPPPPPPPNNGYHGCQEKVCPSHKCCLISAFPGPYQTCSATLRKPANACDESAQKSEWLQLYMNSTLLQQFPVWTSRDPNITFLLSNLSSTTMPGPWSYGVINSDFACNVVTAARLQIA